MEEISATADWSFERLDDLVRRGLPATAVRQLIESGEIATSVVHQIVIPARTLSHRIARRENLTRQEADALVRLLRIQDLARNTFGNRDKAKVWLTSASRMLDGHVPLALLDTEPGGRRVEDALLRIAHGQLA